ncbi:unnamed protein product [Thlaspi arvense]|uniref:Pentatricopeptide repeat-containing protein n=1 Tax=Thlaspi arvense TaxID=13288 RepID=A0AAU9T6X2_THLAR|nr:unnamed protein product [Thlaspi arvense]
MVLLRTRVGFIIKRFSTSATPSTSSASDWKTQLTLFRSATEIASIILQRRDWITHLRYVKSKLPNSTLTPPIFLQIIHETRKSPETTLDFFDWAKTHLRFEPDLKSRCRVIEVATESGLLDRAEALLRPLVETHSVSVIVASMHRWFEGEASLSVSVSLVLECYASKGSYQNGLEVFGSMRRLRLSPSLRAYNSLLDSLVKEDQFRVALCLYSAMVRDRVVSDGLTWDLVAQVLCQHGKSKSVVKLMETGVESCKIYTNLVECYSRNGEFDEVFRVIHEMDDKKLELSFCSYGCVLDDACRLGDAELIDKVLGLMVKKKLLTLDDSAMNDQIIETLCDMGKTFASEMLFHRACDGGTVRDQTYGCMLKALSRKERTKEAVAVYRLICRKGITVLDESCYKEFSNALCRDDDRSEEEEELLVDVIKRGFVPCTDKLSEVLASLCRKIRWDHAEKLLDSVMEMEVYFDSFSCGLLMERYCRSGKLEKAMALHEKIKKMKGSLDANAYNAVLDRLMVRQRTMVEEAVGVFEYMKEMKSMNSKSFTIMIHGLCRVKEMKKAMRYHDEMLKLGLKPDLVTYKRLISCFK